MVEMKTPFQILAETPVPRASTSNTHRRKYESILRFRDSASAQVEVADLESELGLPASPPTFQIGALNDRIRMLRAELARRDSSPPTPPAAKPPPASTTPPPAPPVAEVRAVTQQKPNFDRLHGLDRAIAAHQSKHAETGIAPAALVPQALAIAKLSGHMPVELIARMTSGQRVELAKAANQPAAKREIQIAKLRSQLPFTEGLSRKSLEHKINQLTSEKA